MNVTLKCPGCGGDMPVDVSEHDDQEFIMALGKKMRCGACRAPKRASVARHAYRDSSGREYKLPYRDE